MQHGSKFSLAAALFGWPHAPGHAAPEQQAPDAWVLLFREHHAASDPAVLSGLFTACPTGRDWALEAAPKVTLTLDTTEQQTPAQWLRRIQPLRDTIRARVTAPVRVVIACDASEHSHEAAYAVPSLLCRLDHIAVTEVTLRDLQRPEAESPLAHLPGLLYASVSAFAPHLTTLSLDPCPCALPPPDLLPQLRSLSVTVSGLRMWQVDVVRDILFSVSAYLTQLHTLTVNSGCGAQDDFPWASLEPSTPTRTLTSFSTDVPITNELLDLLTEHVPSLEALCAPGIAEHGVGEYEYAGRTWRVKELTLASCDFDIRGLPRCSSGQPVTVRGDCLTLPCAQEGRGHRFIRRLSDWCFEYKEMFLNADGYPHVVDHPAALHLALAQLCRELQAAGTSTLSLSGWQWDADMLRGYVQALPRLAERGVVSHSLEMNIGVTQELLGMLLQASPHLRSVSVPSLVLQSDTHANTPWPWDELNIDTLDIADLCKLPDPAGQGAPRRVVCKELVLSERTLEVCADYLMHRLQYIQLEFLFSADRQPILKLLGLQDGTAQPTMLLRQLCALRAARVQMKSYQRVLARLEGWPQSWAKKAVNQLPVWVWPRYVISQ